MTPEKRKSAGGWQAPSYASHRPYGLYGRSFGCCLHGVRPNRADQRQTIYTKPLDVPYVRSNRVLTVSSRSTPLMCFQPSFFSQCALLLLFLRLLEQFLLLPSDTGHGPRAKPLGLGRNREYSCLKEFACFHFSFLLHICTALSQPVSTLS